MTNNHQVITALILSRLCIHGRLYVFLLVSSKRREFSTEVCSFLFSSWLEGVNGNYLDLDCTVAQSLFQPFLALF